MFLSKIMNDIYISKIFFILGKIYENFLVIFRGNFFKFIWILLGVIFIIRFVYEVK